MKVVNEYCDGVALEIQKDRIELSIVKIEEIVWVHEEIFRKAGPHSYVQIFPSYAVRVKRKEKDIKEFLYDPGCNFIGVITIDPQYLTPSELYAEVERVLFQIRRMIVGSPVEV